MPFVAGLCEVKGNIHFSSIAYCSFYHRPRDVLPENAHHMAFGKFLFLKLLACLVILEAARLQVVPVFSRHLRIVGFSHPIHQARKDSVFEPARLQQLDNVFDTVESLAGGLRFDRDDLPLSDLLVKVIYQEIALGGLS